jgi:hypothetical protein
METRHASTNASTSLTGWMKRLADHIAKSILKERAIIHVPEFDAIPKRIYTNCWLKAPKFRVCSSQPRADSLTYICIISLHFRPFENRRTMKNLTFSPVRMSFAIEDFVVLKINVI